MKPIRVYANEWVFRVILVVAALSGGTALRAQSVAEFTTRAEVVAPAGSSVVRAEVPAASIAALRGVSGGDLRVFNASGVSLPHALVDASSEPRAQPDTAGVRVASLPIYAAASTTASSAPALRIEEGPTRRVIEYGPAKPATDVATVPRSLLFDTRLVDASVRAVDLEGTLPASSIVKVTLDMSTDLKSWTTLARDAPVFDFGFDGPSNRRVALPVAQRLKDQYLRLNWNTPGSLQIAALKTVVSGALPPITPTIVGLGAPSNFTDVAAEWSVPSSLRVSGLHVKTKASNALMPVRLLTRARAGDVWLPIASTVVYRLGGTDSADNTNPSQPIAANTATFLRVEPLTGYSLKGVPLTLDAEYPPLQVVFVATGEGPFTIATGKPGLGTAALPVSTLIPGYVAAGEFALPLLPAKLVSSVATTKAWADVVGRSALLWAVLGIAVVVLAGLAISLLRAPAKT